ncbi:hypothetical protein [Desulfogranum japonicum]|uniref:hypothetical protein n=1 Tax=Desulfogranum japonicum TaxID=231447 RepID=UPI0003FE3F14|nr:hypothetical protein [Desulfogranum japonicum]
MRLLVSIDDTDNAESAGSGQLMEQMVRRFAEEKLILEYSPISRHQLFVHEQIPYTSHNSGMCCAVTVDARDKQKLSERLMAFLQAESASGSDPGLCIVEDNGNLQKEPLIRYGLQAKREVLSKSLAYSLAEELGLHLSEHGGSGDGVIGALAAIGLKLQGNDGRCRGWKTAGSKGTVASAADICARLSIPTLVDAGGNRVTGSEMVLLAEEKLKTVLFDHQEVLPVKPLNNGVAVSWTTLTKQEVKQF